MFKRIISVCLITVISVACISACAPKQPPIFDDDDDSVNFLGAAFTVFSKDEWLNEKRKRGSTASGDRFLDRIDEIEKNYNVKIRNEYGNLENKILTMTLNGGGGVDMLYCNDDILYRFYELGILTPFDEIGVKDNKSEKFGIPSLLVQGTFDGTQYGIINYLGDGVPGLNGFISINMNMLGELAMTDPHEFDEKGEWNWNNLRAVLKQGTVTEGDENHVGMLCSPPMLGAKAFFSAIIANGGYIIKEIDGVFKSGLCDSNAIEAMEYMTGLVSDGLITATTGGTNWDLWVVGKIWPLLLDGGSGQTEEITYSIVRFPYGPNGNPDIVAAYSYSRSYYAFTILSGFENYEIGIIVDDLFEPLDPDLYAEGWKDYSQENLFYSNRDFETYMTGLETINYYPLGVLFGSNQWSNDEPISQAMDDILSGKSSAQATMDSISDILKDVINEKLNGIK